MKFITKHILKTIAILAIVFSCSSNSETTQEDDLVALNNLKLEIELLIAEGTCTENESCDFIAFGSKACGGPKSYLVFNTSIDVELLNEIVSTYNEMEAEYNLKWGIISDCMFLLPPTNVECVDGQCKAIY
ncbi:MAG: hypothetical protein HKP59_07585 [Lutibacter sp.]|uniref:hypothetical protein n=1 Tax=Lutibacter sp. TaxID=1925666 RepID=UPI0017BF5070|nr:hypothetical protein [Lutibacter sp.]MBT8317471.1 hypothetical protein [Lutibacter sp.]NNJ58330.1 hypothetical protein [Lutibacter sp.]